MHSDFFLIFLVIFGCTLYFVRYFFLLEINDEMGEGGIVFSFKNCRG